MEWNHEQIRHHCMGFLLWNNRTVREKLTTGGIIGLQRVIFLERIHHQH